MAFEDVVRHIILRISVDQENLASELSAARQKIKDLQKAENEANRERVKSFEAVTKAVDKNSEALDDLTQANEANAKSQRKSAQDAEAGHKARTDAIHKEADATRAQILAEAEADRIRSKSNQDQLDAIEKRTARRIEALDKESKREEDLSALERQNDILLGALKTRLDTEQQQRDKAEGDRAQAAHDKEIARINQEIAKTEKLN